MNRTSVLFPKLTCLDIQSTYVTSARLKSDGRGTTPVETFRSDENKRPTVAEYDLPFKVFQAIINIFVKY